MLKQHTDRSEEFAIFIRDLSNRCRSLTIRKDLTIEQLRLLIEEKLDLSSTLDYYITGTGRSFHDPGKTLGELGIQPGQTLNVRLRVRGGSGEAPAAQPPNQPAAQPAAQSPKLRIDLDALAATNQFTEQFKKWYDTPRKLECPFCQNFQLQTTRPDGISTEARLQLLFTHLRAAHRDLLANRHFGKAIWIATEKYVVCSGKGGTACDATSNELTFSRTVRGDQAVYQCQHCRPPAPNPAPHLAQPATPDDTLHKWKLGAYRQPPARSADNQGDNDRNEVTFTLPSGKELTTSITQIMGRTADAAQGILKPNLLAVFDDIARTLFALQSRNENGGGILMAILTRTIRAHTFQPQGGAQPRKSKPPDHHARLTHFIKGDLQALLDTIPPPTASGEAQGKNSDLDTKVQKLLARGPSFITKARKVVDQTPTPPFNEDTVNALKELHPPRDGPPPLRTKVDDLPEPDRAALGKLKLSLAEAQKLAAGLNKSSAPDAFGFDAADMIRLLNSPPASGNDHPLVLYLNALLHGLLTSDNLEAATMARLIPLSKDPEGKKIRPIAICQTVTKIVEKHLIAHFAPAIQEHVGSWNIGAGIKAGAETGAHALNAVLSLMGKTDEDNIVFSIDASNAFGRADVGTILTGLGKVAPAALPYVSMSLAGDTHMFAKGELITRKTGIRQGSPISMLLYPFITKHLMDAVRTSMGEQRYGELYVHFYADDGVIAGRPGAVYEAIKTIETNGPKVGFYLNIAKSVVARPNRAANHDTEAHTAFFDGTRPPTHGLVMGDETDPRTWDYPNQLTVLGACVSSDRKARWDYLLSSAEGALAQITRLRALRRSHLAFTLTLKAANLSLINHLLRTTPVGDWVHPDDPNRSILKQFDNGLINWVRELYLSPLNEHHYRDPHTNPPDPTETELLRLRLPLRLGGLGIRLAGDTAAPAAWASRAQSQELALQLTLPFEQQLRIRLNTRADQPREITEIFEREITDARLWFPHDAHVPPQPNRPIDNYNTIHVAEEGGEAEGRGQMRPARAHAPKQKELTEIILEHRRRHLLRLLADQDDGVHLANFLTTSMQPLGAIPGYQGALSLRNQVFSATVQVALDIFRDHLAKNIISCYATGQDLFTADQKHLHAWASCSPMLGTLHARHDQIAQHIVAALNHYGRHTGVTTAHKGERLYNATTEKNTAPADIRATLFGKHPCVIDVTVVDIIPHCKSKAPMPAKADRLTMPAPPSTRTAMDNYIDDFFTARQNQKENVHGGSVEPGTQFRPFVVSARGVISPKSRILLRWAMGVLEHPTPQPRTEHAARLAELQQLERMIGMTALASYGLGVIKHINRLDNAKHFAQVTPIDRYHQITGSLKLG